MEIGSIVIYAADPLNMGKMIVVSCENGMLLCEAVHADKRGEYYRDLFHPQELELLEVWEQRTPV
jgi:hypothetical protein